MKRKKRTPQSVPGHLKPSRARRVLHDARISTSDFEKHLVSGDLIRTRISWLATITLLRAVGHVLKGHDAKRSPYLAEAIEDEFRKCETDPTRHQIFFGFVVNERNNLLKEYADGIFEVVSVEEGGDGTIKVMPIIVEASLYSPSEALRKALGWWEAHLDRVQDGAQAKSHAAKASPL